MQNKSTTGNLTRFNIGWGILLFFVIANIAGHIGLLLFDPGGTDGRALFVTWAALNFLGATMLLIPYRRGERWAWYAAWVVMIPYASIILFNSEFGFIYLAEALLMAVAQSLTYSRFFVTL